jgi:hypothetical protein
LLPHYVNASENRKSKIAMSQTEEVVTSEEEKKNHRFSFIVGIFIGMAIIVVLVILSLFVH